MPLLHDPAVRTSLEARLAALRPDSPHQWGSMTPDQMLWHVNQVLATSLGGALGGMRLGRVPPFDTKRIAEIA